jgi:DNA invertase Pin-like site-specific DNA recombinase
MANSEYVAYYRVSTRKQGDSGLGLEAQQEAVRSFLNGVEPMASYEEVESGKRSDRPALLEALAMCRSSGATLIIAKLDRLARNVLFTATLMKSTVKFKAVDFPDANNLTIHILAAVAEHEAAMVSVRTKAALAAAKARGTLLGRRDDAIAAHASKGNKVSALTRTAKAQRHADDLQIHIRAVKKAGAISLRQIADSLNKTSMKTARGGKWSATQVQRVLARA